MPDPAAHSAICACGIRHPFNNGATTVTTYCCGCVFVDWEATAKQGAARIAELEAELEHARKLAAASRAGWDHTLDALELSTRLNRELRAAQKQVLKMLDDFDAGGHGPLILRDVRRLLALPAEKEDDRG